MKTNDRQLKCVVQIGIRRKAEVKFKLLIIKYIHPRKIIQRAHNEGRYNSYILYTSSNTAEIYIAVYFSYTTGN